MRPGFLWLADTPGRLRFVATEGIGPLFHGPEPKDLTKVGLGGLTGLVVVPPRCCFGSCEAQDPGFEH